MKRFPTNSWKNSTETMEDPDFGETFSFKVTKKNKVKTSFYSVQERCVYHSIQFIKKFQSNNFLHIWKKATIVLFQGEKSQVTSCNQNLKVTRPVNLVNLDDPNDYTNTGLHFRRLAIPIQRNCSSLLQLLTFPQSV